MASTGSPMADCTFFILYSSRIVKFVKAPWREQRGQPSIIQSRTRSKLTEVVVLDTHQIADGPAERPEDNVASLRGQVSEALASPKAKRASLTRKSSVSVSTCDGSVSEKKRYDPVTMRRPIEPMSRVRTVENEECELHEGSDMERRTLGASAEKVISESTCWYFVEGMPMDESSLGPESVRKAGERASSAR